MTPAEIVEEAKCFSACVPPGMQAALQTYLLNQLRIQGGGSAMTVEELIESAKCYSTCINPGMQTAVQTYLLDEILTSIS